jgi:hypothetical protein
MESRGTPHTTSGLIAGLVVSAAWFGGGVALVAGAMFMFPPDGSSTPEPMWGVGLAMLGVLAILIPWAGIRAGKMSPGMQIVYVLLFAAVIVSGVLVRSFGTVLAIIDVALSIPVVTAIRERNRDKSGD